MVQNKKKYTLFLINPKADYKHLSIQREFAQLMCKKTLALPLGLPIVAALTPDNYNIRIIDEDYEKIPLNEKPDIVGLTSVISSVDRAFEIADYYKSKGVPVVMGGFCVYFLVEEALQHADSVVLGVAQGAWEELLKDFEQGKLKKTYKAKVVDDFKTSPFPRWDLINKNNVMTIPVEVSRGCPFKCEFCFVHKIYGNKMKYRNVDNVIEEIKNAPLKTIFFVDDNLTFNKKYAKELMTKLKPLKINWTCQSSIDVANDDELLRLMADAGCMFILIGFESINFKSLKEAGKIQNNIEKYENAINKIHSYGMQIISAFIVGFDSGTLEDMDHIYDFTYRNNLSSVMLSILATCPGSDLYDRMKKEKRLNNTPRKFINSICPTIIYKNFTQVDFLTRYYDTLKRIYSPETIYKKAIELFSSGNFKSKAPGEVTIKQKLNAMYILLKSFLLSKNKTKRKLLIDLFKLANKKITTHDNVVSYLISMEGYMEYVKKYQNYYNDIIPFLQSVDKQQKIKKQK